MSTDQEGELLFGKKGWARVKADINRDVKKANQEFLAMVEHGDRFFPHLIPPYRYLAIEAIRNTKKL